MAKTDCHFCTTRKCRILTQRLCDTRECPFYKTTQQYRADLEKYPPFDYATYKENREYRLSHGGVLK